MVGIKIVRSTVMSSLLQRGNGSQTHRVRPRERSIDTQRQQLTRCVIESLDRKCFEWYMILRTVHRVESFCFCHVQPSRCLCQRVELKEVLRMRPGEGGVAKRDTHTPRRFAQGPSHPYARRLAYTIPGRIRITSDTPNPLFSSAPGRLDVFELMVVQEGG